MIPLTPQEQRYLYFLVSAEAIRKGAEVTSGNDYTDEEATRYDFLEQLRDKLNPETATIPKPTHAPASV